MDLQRSLLFAALCAVVVMLWQAWQHDYPVTSPAQPTTINASQQPITEHNPVNDNQGVALQNASLAATTKHLIKVKTDVLNVELDTFNGTVKKVELNAYPASLDQKAPLTLLNDQPDSLYLASSGLVGNLIPKEGIIYSAEQLDYQLNSNDQNLQVKLTWSNQGLRIIKTFNFTRGSYLVTVNYSVQNQTNTQWSGNFYAQLIRQKPINTDHSMFHINPFVGAAVSSPEKRYQKLSFDELQKQNLNQTTTQGWMAMQQHYFLSAWVPPADQAYHYTSQQLENGAYLLQMSSPSLTIAPGQTVETSVKLYTGPAEADILKNIAPGLDLTVDYGVLWIISSAIFWLMKQIYLIVHNWGWAIVIVTLLIKLLFYHLSAKSYRSMAAMRKLQPRMLQLKERYGDDRQKLSQATLELYKTEKVNPLGGCLPILVQIPVFIALYWVLAESVELRQAPFILWIRDLAIPDPYYILPIIMGLTMFIQQKMSPPPPDPVQAKVMMFLPVVFTVFFLNFPAGLVLYWLVNNTLSILQQWYITYKYEHAPVKKANKKKR